MALALLHPALALMLLALLTSLVRPVARNLSLGGQTRPLRGRHLAQRRNICDDFFFFFLLLSPTYPTIPHTHMLSQQALPRPSPSPFPQFIYLF
jgi:hypothetical protein